MLYLFAASLLVFTSCSKDDNDSSNSTSSILPKKVTTTYSGGDSDVQNIVYNGNKIVTSTDQDGYVIKYTYTGEFITKVEEFDKDGKLDKTTDYTYLNGKLNTSVEKSADPTATYYYETKFMHNADGTVFYENFRGLILTGVEQEYGATGKYTFKDQNLVKLEVSYYGNEYSYVYEYDTKNNPLKNVLGYNLLLEDENASVNNVLKETSTSGSGAKISTSTTTYSYKYDANNYPTETVKSYPSGTSVATQTTQIVY
ncbi:hypothetical protein [Flavobacterium frigidimaris]|uniref:hypothetical protein n=1 Tax=Flavobacterium frigidimaris TaxID=262320 RepID=UPI001A9648E4|nr:hypothetical protein [Flavobacterium frigidimaris]